MDVKPSLPLLCITMTLYTLCLGWRGDFYCPPRCTCYVDYFDSSNTVECFRKQLFHVPANLFLETHVLILAENHLEELTKESFKVIFFENPLHFDVRKCAYVGFITEYTRTFSDTANWKMVPRIQQRSSTFCSLGPDELGNEYRYHISYRLTIPCIMRNSHSDGMVRRHSQTGP